jgi:putative ABC transport system ATP-binding protein
LELALSPVILPSEEEKAWATSVYVEETVAAYDSGADTYGRRFAQVDLTEYIERFIARVKIEEGPVLDAGCGRVLVADEPTGHQDEASAQAVFETLAWASETGTCCVVATHNGAIDPFLDRKLTMENGRLAGAEDRNAAGE